MDLRVRKQLDYLSDKNFLKIIDNLKLKKQYTKITVLDWQENAIQDFQGHIVSGNLNIDGQSAIRRSCNFTMTLDQEFNNDPVKIQKLFAINTKFSLCIGVENETPYYKDYPIIWFPLGIFIMINPSFSHGLDGITISMQAKDKMCLLNGECGGVIPATVILHEQESINANGEYIIIKPTIYKIIQELVNHFGNEQLGKILINNIEERIKGVVKWEDSHPLYIYEKINEKNPVLKQYYPSMSANLLGYDNKIQYNAGQDIGYTLEKFTYPGELIAQQGQSVCDILEIIKNTLGNYEYFYDVYGNFIFQEKQNFINTSESTKKINNMTSMNYYDFPNNNIIYNFNNGNLITSYSNTPQYSLIKNDFIIWGKKKDKNNREYPIRYHLAIDQKPTVGNEYDIVKYKDKNGFDIYKVPISYDSVNNFPVIGQEEYIYLDKQNNKVYKWDLSTKKYIIIGEPTKVKTADWRTELFMQGANAEPLGLYPNYYYSELKNEWPKIYNIDSKQPNFKVDYLENGTNLDYFLDFIDVFSEIGKISVNNIGRRTKVITDDKINCIFEPSIPNLIIVDIDNPEAQEIIKECDEKKFEYVQVNSNLFTKMSRGGYFNSAFELAKNLLYENTYLNESISLQSLPIYYLEPNTRIQVQDIENNIFGIYSIQSISFSLDVNSTMSISAVKEIEKI